jgi:hypothetical protein
VNRNYFVPAQQNARVEGHCVCGDGQHRELSDHSVEQLQDERVNTSVPVLVSVRCGIPYGLLHLAVMGRTVGFVFTGECILLCLRTLVADEINSQWLCQ